MYLSEVRSHKYILFSYNNNYLKAFFLFLVFLEKKGGQFPPLATSLAVMLIILPAY